LGFNFLYSCHFILQLASSLKKAASKSHQLYLELLEEMTIEEAYESATHGVFQQFIEGFR